MESEVDKYIFDINDIKNSINENGKITINDSIFLKNDLFDKEEGIILGDVKLKNENYLGLLKQSVSNSLLRHVFGYNKYNNGDIYIGQFEDGMKHGRGIYFVNGEHSVNNLSDTFDINNKNDNKSSKNSKTSKNSKSKEIKLNFELFDGNFVNDKKHGLGVEIIVSQAMGNEDLLNSDVKAFIGSFYNDFPHNGLNLEKNGDSFLAYYGTFDENGLKHDSMGLTYDNKNDRVFRACYEHGELNYGYLVEFKEEEGEKLNIELRYLKFQNKKLSIINSTYIDTDTREKIEFECKEFRRLLYDEELFEKTYNNFVDRIKLKSKIKSFDSLRNCFDEVKNKTSSMEAFINLHRII